MQTGTVRHVCKEIILKNTGRWWILVDLTEWNKLKLSLDLDLVGCYRFLDNMTIYTRWKLFKTYRLNLLNQWNDDILQKTKKNFSNKSTCIKLPIQEKWVILENFDSPRKRSQVPFLETLIPLCWININLSQICSCCMKQFVSLNISSCPFSALLISDIHVGDEFNRTSFDSTGYAQCWNQTNDVSGGGRGIHTFDCTETRLGRYVAINFQNSGSGVLDFVWSWNILRYRYKF